MPSGRLVVPALLDRKLPSSVLASKSRQVIARTPALSSSGKDKRRPGGGSLSTRLEPRRELARRHRDLRRPCSRAQILEAHNIRRRLVLAEDKRKTRAAGIGTLHLRLEAAAP